MPNPNRDAFAIYTRLADNRAIAQFHDYAGGQFSTILGGNTPKQVGLVSSVSSSKGIYIASKEMVTSPSSQHYRISTLTKNGAVLVSAGLNPLSNSLTSTSELRLVNGSPKGIGFYSFGYSIKIKDFEVRDITLEYNNLIQELMTSLGRT